MREPKIREQLSALRQVLAETRKKELSWSEAGSDGNYTARIGRDAALLSRDDDGYVKLQFMTDDRPEFTVQLVQLGRDAEPTNEEVDRDGLLSLLIDMVEQQVNPEGGENAMSRFTRR